jgi:GGDEF domain-containing protein
VVDEQGIDSAFRHILDATVSAGGSLVAAGDPDDRAALARADAAMYTAKHRGRDEFETSGNGRSR